MIGKWKNWYNNLDYPQPYGDTKTYDVGEEWLKGLAVEDWGCGKGFFRSVHDGEYLGVDGTSTVFSDVVADLREYKSSTPGLFMRHVLEHNLEWDKVLQNAVDSFDKRMVLVIFTPMKNKTQQIAWNEVVEVPDMSFSHKDLVSYFKDYLHDWKDYRTGTQYKVERVYRLEK